MSIPGLESGNERWQLRDCLPGFPARACKRAGVGVLRPLPILVKVEDSSNPQLLHGGKLRDFARRNYGSNQLDPVYEH